MSAITPRRSTRIPHTHTPKMSERKKGLFQGECEPARDSLTKHRHLPVVDSESDSEDCDLGIISTLDSSSGEDNDVSTPKRLGRTLWPESSQKKLLKENHDLKNFIKSPFTLKKYQTRYSCPDGKCSGSASTPATPHFHHHPGTPSSTHSCASVHTTSSTSSRARKSLASLIADTESCSSSLKDLNFDTDSGTDSKENTPSKGLRRSVRKLKTPQTNSFKGVLVEQRKNVTPMKTAIVCLTKMDMSNIISPTQMLKTPHNTIEVSQSPPKLGHNRRSIVEIEESPESVFDNDKSHKRLRNDSMTESGPHSKYPRLDNTVPKARLSLFNSDRLKEILSAKSFYGKSNPELNTNVTAKISKAIEVTNTHHRRPFTHSRSNRRKRRPDKPDPFDKEKQTIEELLSQWNEEEIPESELSITKKKSEVPCFNSSVIEETNAIFQPVTAIPVPVQSIPHDKEAVIVELGSKQMLMSKESLPAQETVVQDVVMSEPESYKESHGDVPKNGQFLPVEGGYIFVGDNAAPEQEELPDLDEIERELKMLDEQILKMAQSNNINAEAVLASTETIPAPIASDVPSTSTSIDAPQKLFPIFSNPNPGTTTPSSKG
ncbi:unnamed protein product [Diatraea saccharalis]|uniref:Uncharacterized protein n=1 Tax=Diatraea saccharalis TaxID=40085 RepID=A0A9N9WFN6_9NEOP|nr:unnamed protein product [Diatraea saccharalis]